MTARDERDPYAVAIGAYLRRRARLEGITAEQAAEAAGKGTATVNRLYAGTVETGLIGGLRLLALVRGSAGASAAPRRSPHGPGGVAGRPRCW